MVENDDKNKNNSINLPKEKKSSFLMADDVSERLNNKAELDLFGNDESDDITVKKKLKKTLKPGKQYSVKNKVLKILKEEKYSTIPITEDLKEELFKVCNYDNKDSLLPFMNLINNYSLLTLAILKYSNNHLLGYSKKIDNISKAFNIFNIERIKGFALIYIEEEENLKFSLSSYDEVQPLKKLDIYVGYNNNNNNNKNYYDIKSFNHVSKLRQIFFTSLNNNISFNNTYMEVLSLLSYIISIGKIYFHNLLMDLSMKNEFIQISSYVEVNSIYEIEDKICELEKEVLGMNYIDILYEIVKNWNLNTKFLSILKYFNRIEEIENNDALKDRIIYLKEGLKIINSYNFIDSEAHENSLEVIEENKLDGKAWGLSIKMIMDQTSKL